MRILLTILTLVCFGMPAAAQEYTAITGGTVIHTHADEKVADAVVLIRGTRIEAVGPASEITVPATARRIDATGAYIIPGLIEGHMHFFQSGGLYTRPDGFDLRHRRSYTEELAWIRENVDDVFRRYLACGITTVADAGGPMWNFDIREQAQASPTAPHVLVTGPLIASYQPDALTTDDPPIIRVQSADDALALVHEQAARGADYIKIWYIGKGASTLDPAEFDVIVRAVVKESHAMGLPVWVHATELELAKASVRAGADVLVHSVTDAAVDGEFIDLLKEHHTVLVPTLHVFESYGRVYAKKLQLIPEELRLANPSVVSTLFDMYELRDEELSDRIRALQAKDDVPGVNPLVLDNLRKLHEAGITIAAGSDAGNVGVLHGPGLYRDFILMRRAGMSAHDVLVSATLNGAVMLGRESELGSLEAGKIADIVILDANPLDDIMNVAQVRTVVVAGKAHTPGELLPTTPADLAQMQLNAYNARNLESFLAVYSDDVEVYTYPDDLQYRGKEHMRKLYGEFFDASPNLHCRLVDRLTYRNTVIDSEEVTGVPGQEFVRAVAIYEIEDGMIVRVRFIQ